MPNPSDTASLSASLAGWRSCSPVACHSSRYHQPAFAPEPEDGRGDPAAFHWTTEDGTWKALSTHSGASDCQMQFRFNVNSCPNTKRESFHWCALFPAIAVAKTSMLLFKAKLRRATLHIALKSTIMDVLTVPSYFACVGHHQCLTGEKKMQQKYLQTCC